MDAPSFEVVTPAATVSARRLTTAAKVQAVLFGGTATDTTLIEAMIDRVSAIAARRCMLAQAGATFPTFGRETCRATWRETRSARDCILLLPWRVPVVSISSVVEDGVTLDAATYALRSGAIVERLVDGVPSSWSAAEVAITYVTGWDLGTDAARPPDLEAAAIEQVKAMYASRARDPALRSRAVEEVGSEAYSVPGGDSIGSTGLLPFVLDTLDAYRPPAV